MEVIRTTIAVKEAAEYLGVSYWKLLDIVRKKQMPCIRAGKKLLFRVETLENWLKQEEQASIKKEPELIQ